MPDKRAELELDAEQLVYWFTHCRKAFDALQDTPHVTERLLRMLHGYTLTDWIKVKSETLFFKES